MIIKIYQSLTNTNNMFNFRECNKYILLENSIPCQAGSCQYQEGNIKEINQNMKDTRIGLERNCRGFLQFLFSKPRDYTQSCNLSSHERGLPLSIP